MSKDLELLFEEWKRTALVFVFQVIVVAIAYAQTGDVAKSLFISAFTVIFLGAVAEQYLPHQSVFAFLFSLSAVGIMVHVTMYVIAATTMIIIGSWAMYQVEDKNSKESPWVSFLMRCPLGIGTVIGGAYLLGRRDAESILVARRTALPSLLTR